MDLLSSRPLREGSRGGASEFSWEAVKSDKDRENYLGHSLMAPVGRWQQGRDLTWYAKGEASTLDEEREKRLDEIRKIKEAEEDAMAAALGLPVKVRVPREEERVSRDEIRRAVGDIDREDDVPGGGVGFGKSAAAGAKGDGQWEKAEGYEFGRDQRERVPQKGTGYPKADVRRNERSDKATYREGERSRNKDRLRAGRDRSRSKERRGERSKHHRSRRDDGGRVSRRHREERSSSPSSRRRSRSRSRSRQRRRDGGGGGGGGGDGGGNRTERSQSRDRNRRRHDEDRERRRR